MTNDMDMGTAQENGGGVKGEERVMRAGTSLHDLKFRVASTFMACISLVLGSLAAVSEDLQTLKNNNVFESNWIKGICSKVGLDQAVNSMIDALAGVNFVTASATVPIGRISTRKNGQGERQLVDFSSSTIAGGVVAWVRRSSSRYMNIMSTEKFDLISSAVQELANANLKDGLAALSRNPVHAGPVVKVAQFAASFLPSGYYSRALELLPLLSGRLERASEKIDLKEVTFDLEVSGEFLWLGNWLREWTGEVWNASAANAWKGKGGNPLWISERHVSLLRLFVVPHDDKAFISFSLPQHLHDVVTAAKGVKMQLEVLLQVAVGEQQSHSSLRDACMPSGEYGRVVYLRDDQICDAYIGSDDWVIFPDSAAMLCHAYLLEYVMFCIFKGRTICAGVEGQFLSHAGLRANRLVVVIPGSGIDHVRLTCGLVIPVGIEMNAFGVVRFIQQFSLRVNNWARPTVPSNFRVHDWIYGVDALAKLFFTQSVNWVKTSGKTAVSSFVPAYAQNIGSTGRREILIDWKVGDFKTNWMVTREYLKLVDPILGDRFRIDLDALKSAWGVYGLNSGYMIDKVMQAAGAVYLRDSGKRWDSWSLRMWKATKAARIFLPYASSGDYEHSLAFFPDENNQVGKYGSQKCQVFYRGFSIGAITGMAAEVNRQADSKHLFDTYKWFAFDGTSRDSLSAWVKENPFMLRWVGDGWYENGALMKFDLGSVDTNPVGRVGSEPFIAPVIRVRRLVWHNMESDGEMISGALSSVPEGVNARSEMDAAAFSDF